MSSLPIMIALPLAALVAAAAVYDFRFRRIPNWLNLSGVILGLGLNTFCFGLHGGLRSFEGLVLALAVYLPFYLLRGMGAGDVKLMAAVGSLAGPSNWFCIFVFTSVLGAVAGVVLAMGKRRFGATCCNVYFMAKDLLQLRAPYKTNPQMDFRNRDSLRLPHGVVIALGCGVSLAWPLIQA
jgi:prepilin peptidase CpaA